MTLGDQGDEVALLRFAHVLRGQNDRSPAVTQPVKLRPDRPTEEGIEARSWFIEEQDGRIVDQGARKLQAALHAPGELRRAAPALAPQVDQLQDGTYPPTTTEEEHPEQARHEIHVLARRQIGIQAEELGHVSDPFPGSPPKALRVFAEDARDTRRGSQAAGQDSHSGGLAGAARADNAQQGARRDGLRDAVESDDIPIPPAQPLQDDGGRRCLDRG